MKNPALPLLFKHSSLLILIIAFSNAAFCQKPDTAIFYFANYGSTIARVSSPEDADFMRMMTSNHSDKKHLDVMEYYKNGQIKLIGKSRLHGSDNLKKGNIQLDGDCITYYGNGKRESIAHYTSGYKDGMEYDYFLDGHLYCSINNIYGARVYEPQVLFWDCYDVKGNMICKNGNGHWIIYNSNDSISLEGSIKNGLRHGLWHGHVAKPFALRYDYKYDNKGQLIGGTGYDSTGRAYSFETEVKFPFYNLEDPLAFLQTLRRKFKAPKDTSGKEIDPEGLNFSFTVEKDGSVSNAEFLGNKYAPLTIALREAILKCEKWHPGLYYGIPCKCRLIMAFVDPRIYQSDAWDVNFPYKVQLEGL